MVLDMDSTLGATIDHSLTTWRTFEDTANGIRIRLTEAGVDAIGWYADVLIER